MLVGKKIRICLAIAAAATALGITPAPAMAADEATEAITSVVSTVDNGDGTISQTNYMRAPGVTAEELAANLRASGETGVSVEVDADVSAAVAACKLGTARTWASSTTCFPKWSTNGAVRPIIDFVDHSGSSWPVGRAVTKWNETSGIDSIYRPASSGCDGAPTHCVGVYSKNYGATGWVGATTNTLNSAGTYWTSSKVELNDYYGGSETEKWNTACHELGHTLGLDHNTSKSSCLYYARADGVSKYPNADDVALLERYY